MSNSNITVNGKKVSKAELSKIREETKTQKGVKLVEVSPNNFKKQIKG